MASSHAERHMRFEQTINQAAAVLLPLFEIGGIAYATYTLIYLVGVQYLLDPSPELFIKPRKATGIALIVVYCLLLLFCLIAFLRMVQVIWMNPGLVPLGDPATEKEQASRKHFDQLDAYICDYEGAPRWCDSCHNWKPDRAHHSTQQGRCVRRMDHFCPYAGGIISETSHKFFVQFLFYGSLYTGFVLIVMAVFLAERGSQHNGRPATWIVALGLGAVFFMFAFGMFVTTFYNMAINYTTVETMQKGGIHNIALRGRAPAQSPIDRNALNVLCEIQRTESRSYIVVQTQPGENPWDRGVWENLKDIMGDTVLQWLLPWKMSPCTVHNDSQGEFKWGPVVTRLMDEHNAGSAYGRSPRSRRRQSSRTTRSVTHVHV